MTRALLGLAPAGANNAVRKADLTAANISGLAVGANPTALVGLTAINGSSANWMRADGSPAVNVAISPTWTGNHTFSPTSGTPLSATSVAGANAIVLQGSTTAGQSYGLSIGAGTNASDFAMNVYSASGTAFMKVAGDGGFILGAATGSSKGVGTINATGYYLNGTALATGTPANPTASLGLTAINGSASTFMRSDGAPALNVGISPTWTGAHTFSPAGAASGITVNGYSGQVAAQINGNTTTNNSYGLYVTAGTSASDVAFLVRNAAASSTFLTIAGNGGVGINSAVYGWSNFISVDIGNGALASYPTGSNTDIRLESNEYYDGSNYRYKKSDYSASFIMNGGAFAWLNSPSGTAGAVAYLTTRMNLSNTGALTVNGVAVSSDVNLKENIAPIPHALDAIQSLNGVCFDWKETGERSAGLIAQDVEAVMPELVGAGLNDMKSLNYNGIIAVLVEAVKEQQAQIDALKRFKS